MKRKLLVSFVLCLTIMYASTSLGNAIEVEENDIIIENNIEVEDSLDKFGDADEIMLSNEEESELINNYEDENETEELKIVIEDIVFGTESSLYLATETTNTKEGADVEYTYDLLDDTSIEITGYTGEDNVIVIPEVVDGYTVTSIGEGAFLDKTELEEVSIPEGVVNIGKSAFRGCTKLEAVNIPSGITEIKEFTFYECEGLKEIKLPDGLKSIGARAFQGTGLTDIVFPDGLESIGLYAFHVCLELGNVYIPRSVTDLDAQAFYNCSATVYIYADSKAANCLAYQDSGNTVSGNFCSPSAPEYVIHKVECEDGSYYLTVEDYLGSEESIRLPSEIDGVSVKKVECYAFAKSLQLKEVYIPNGYIAIKYLAFYLNESIVKIYVPSTVTEVDQAFEHKPILQCHSGSYIESWAKENSCPFELVDTIDDALLPHTVEVDEEIPASCTETGMTEGSHCSVCGMIITEQEIIPATQEHVWDDGQITVEATYTENGERTYICENCGTTKTEEIPMLEPDSNLIAIDEINFPDDCFREYIKNNFDSNSDGYLSTDEIAKVTSMHIQAYEEGESRTYAEDLTGIKYFELLESIVVEEGTFEALDFSNMLTLKDVTLGIDGYVGVKKLDFSNCSSLTYITTTSQELKSIDVSGCSSLQTLYLGDGGDLVQLDVSDNTNLENLNCSSHDLTEIDLTNNTKLKYLTLENNNLISLDLSNCFELQYLNCYGNCITYLDLSNQFNLSTNNISSQVSVAGIIKTGSGWLVNMNKIVGKDNINSINLQSNWTMREDGYAYYDGDTMPEFLYYSCNTECPVLYLNLSVKLLFFEENCEHNYVEVETSATCTQKGEKKLVCSICDEIKDGSVEELPLREHSWNDGEITAESTCTGCGEIIYTCTVCGEAKKEEILANGHVWNTEHTVDKAATCTETGSKSIHCSVCNAVKDGSTEQIPLSNHKWNIVYVVDKEPTCTSAGSKSYHCSVCDAKMEGSDVTISAAGHTWGTWNQTVAPTIKAEGTEERECSACHETEKRSVSKLPLNLTTVKLNKLEVVSGDHLKVSWKKVDGADGYLVYRRNNGKWQQIAKVKGNNLTYTDKTTKIGTKYTYTVKAYTDLEDGTVYGGYNKTGVSLTQTYYKASIELTSAKATSTKAMQIKWKTRSKADGYVIFRKTPGTKWKKIATVGKKASYTDKTCKSATTYLYTVKAYTKVDGKTIYSNYNNSGIAATTKMLKPTLKVASKAKKKATISWSKQSNVSGYAIYRKEAGGNWSKIKTVSAKKASYVDKNLKSGKTYYYAVKAYIKANPKVGIDEPIYSAYNIKKVKIK